MLFVLLHVLIASFYYLGTRAEITRFIWSRYPKRFATFMDCASCAGFWWGLALGVSYVVGQKMEIGLGPYSNTYLTLAPNTSVFPIFLAFTSIVITPMIAALHQHTMWFLGSAVAAEEETPSDE